MSLFNNKLCIQTGEDIYDILQNAVIEEDVKHNCYFFWWKKDTGNKQYVCSFNTRYVILYFIAERLIKRWPLFKFQRYLFRPYQIEGAIKSDNWLEVKFIRSKYIYLNCFLLCWIVLTNFILLLDMFFLGIPYFFYIINFIIVYPFLFIIYDFIYLQIIGKKRLKKFIHHVFKGHDYSFVKC